LRPINLAQSVGSVTHTAVHRSPGAKFTLKVKYSKTMFTLLFILITL